MFKILKVGYGPESGIESSSTVAIIGEVDYWQVIRFSCLELFSRISNGKHLLHPRDKAYAIPRLESRHIIQLIDFVRILSFVVQPRTSPLSVPTGYSFFLFIVTDILTLLLLTTIMFCLTLNTGEES